VTSNVNDDNDEDDEDDEDDLFHLMLSLPFTLTPMIGAICLNMAQRLDVTCIFMILLLLLLKSDFKLREFI